LNSIELEISKDFQEKTSISIEGLQKMSTKLRLIVPAGKATPTPPVGPALGQRGVKSMDFCKQFNDRTKHYTPGIPIQALLTIQQSDKSFTFITKTPPASWWLNQAAGIDKGSARAGDVIVGKLSLKHIYEIAQLKKADPAFQDSDLRQVCSRLIGTAQGMGIQVIP
jgi:large subunit ribosomal protein L11